MSLSDFVFVVWLLVLLDATFGDVNTPWLLFCDSDGRLGHQIDSLLGALQLCLSLGRGLVLPSLLESKSWIHPDLGQITQDPESVAVVDFGTIFNISLLSEHLSLISGKESQRAFQLHFGNASAYCSNSLLREVRKDLGKKAGCRSVVDSSPICRHRFASLGIQFTTDRFYDHLLGLKGQADPMVILGRASPFPVPTPTVNRQLQGNLHWSEPIQRRAESLLKRLTPRHGRFLAVHINARPEWSAFCRKNASAYNPLFETCMSPGDDVPEDACDPVRETLLTQVSQALEITGTCAVLVLSDAKFEGSDLEWRLDPTDLEADGCDEGIEVQSMKLQVTLASQAAAISAAARSRGFIGHCCSRISDLIAREREFVWGNRKKSWFWGSSKIGLSAGKRKQRLADKKKSKRRKVKRKGKEETQQDMKNGRKSTGRKKDKNSDKQQSRKRDGKSGKSNTKQSDQRRGVATKKGKDSRHYEL